MVVAELGQATDLAQQLGVAGVEATEHVGQRSFLSERQALGRVDHVGCIGQPDRLPLPEVRLRPAVPHVLAPVQAHGHEQRRVVVVRAGVVVQPPGVHAAGLGQAIDVLLDRAPHALGVGVFVARDVAKRIVHGHRQVEPPVDAAPVAAPGGHDLGTPAQRVVARHGFGDARAHQALDDGAVAVEVRLGQALAEHGDRQVDHVGRGVVVTSHVDGGTQQAHAAGGLEEQARQVVGGVGPVGQQPAQRHGLDGTDVADAGHVVAVQLDQETLDQFQRAVGGDACGGEVGLVEVVEVDVDASGGVGGDHVGEPQGLQGLVERVCRAGGHGVADACDLAELGSTAWRGGVGQAARRVGIGACVLDHGVVAHGERQRELASIPPPPFGQPACAVCQRDRPGADEVRVVHHLVVERAGRRQQAAPGHGLDVGPIGRRVARHAVHVRGVAVGTPPLQRVAIGRAQPGPDDQLVVADHRRHAWVHLGKSVGLGEHGAQPVGRPGRGVERLVFGEPTVHACDRVGRQAVGSCGRAPAHGAVAASSRCRHTRPIEHVLRHGSRSPSHRVGRTANIHRALLCRWCAAVYRPDVPGANGKPLDPGVRPAYMADVG